QHTCESATGGRRRLEATRGAKARGMRQPQMQHDTTADGAAKANWPIEAQGIDHRQDRRQVSVRGQAVGTRLPAGRWRGLAMPGQIKSDDAEALGEGVVIHQAAVLAPIRARRMQAQQRNALARLLDIDAMRRTGDLEVEIAPNRWLEARTALGIHHTPATAARGSASSSLKKRRLAMKGC